jgi:hypothetical protein
VRDDCLVRQLQKKSQSAHGIMTLHFVTGFKVQTRKTSLTGCRTSHHKPLPRFC